MKVLVDTQKLTPRDAFVQAHDEKSMKMATVMLEQTIAEEQVRTFSGCCDCFFTEIVRSLPCGVFPTLWWQNDLPDF
jgi:hypothetical protein